jgi:hypothetical protein
MICNAQIYLVNRRQSKKNGTPITFITFVDIDTGKSYEELFFEEQAKGLNKGDLVRLTLNPEWQDQNGNPVQRLRILEVSRDVKSSLFPKTA